MNADEALETVETLPATEVERALAAEVRRLQVAGDALMGVARSLAYAWETDTSVSVMWGEWAKVQPAINAWMDARRGEGR